MSGFEELLDQLACPADFRLWYCERELTGGVCLYDALLDGVRREQGADWSGLRERLARVGR